MNIKNKTTQGVEVDTTKKQNVSKSGIKITDTEVKQAIKAIDSKTLDMLNAKVNTTTKGSTFKENTTIRVIADDDRCVDMLNSLPKQVRILLLNGVCNTFKGHATARQLQDWWVKSEYYDSSGQNGYKQDILNEGNNDSKDFVSTYFNNEGLSISRKGFTPADYNEVIVVR